MSMLQRGHSGDGCVLASTLCKYDLRKGDLFVLSWARVRRVLRGSISLELLMCGGGVRSILLLPLVAGCLETIDVCIWNMFVVQRPLLKTLLNYVVCLCRGCDGCCVFCLYCEAWSCRCSCMGSVVFRHAYVVCLLMLVSVFAITERRDIGLYEVPLSVSLLGFGIWTRLAKFHV